MKRKPDYVVERAVHGDHFKNETVNLLTGQYGISRDAAEVAFENCMSMTYAVIVPVCEEYPNGVLIATDAGRRKVVIG